MKNSDRVTGTDTRRRTVLKAASGGLALAATAPGWTWAQTPKRGGTLRVSNGGDPPDFDMHQSATFLAQFIAAPCYSNLLRIDPGNLNRLLPDLAERSDISDDGRTVTFQLRSGVIFHNGMPLTAEDVVYSLERVRNPPKGIVSPRKGLLGNVEAIEARGAQTVVITLAQPQPDFLFLVSNPFNVIVPKKVAEPLDAQGQGMKRQIVGTGPFRLTQAVDGQIYELTRFDKYFGTPAYLDKIQFFPIKGEIERSAALQGKRIDACFHFNSASSVETLRKIPGMTVQHRPMPTFVNLIVNVQKKPFDDIRVREALSLAVDREAFVKTVGPLSGASFHGLGLMPPGSPFSLSPAEVKQFGGYNTLPGLGGNIAANRQRALALLEQAGVPKGFKIVLPTRGDTPAFRDASINVASQLKTIGLDATVDIRDTGAFYAIEAKGDFQVVVHSVAVGGSTADQILGEGYTSFGGRNYGRWKDDELDALYRQQSRERDPKRRVELIKQFQLAFMKSYYHIQVAWGGIAAAHWSTVQGWTGLPDLYSNMQLERTWINA
ncbi:MAG: ABC transporter substrate-binding protein [Betaproteobacteria bacterium]